MEYPWEHFSCQSVECGPAGAPKLPRLDSLYTYTFIHRLYTSAHVYTQISFQYSMRDARGPHQPIHEPVNPGSSKTEAQEASRRLPRGSQRLPGGSQEAPGVPQERHTEAASHPEPMGLVTAAPF